MGLEAASPLSGDCDSNRNICVSSLEGTWEPASSCGGNNNTTTDDATDDEPSTGENVTGAFPDFGDSTGQDDTSGSPSRFESVSKLVIGMVLASLLSMAL